MTLPAQPSAETSSRLAALIERGIVLSDQLNEILQSESDALAGRAPGDIQALATRKGTLVTDVEQTGAALVAVLGEPAPRDPDAVARRVAELADGSVVERWRHLEGILDACRHANARNGGAIRALRSYTSRLLELMHGEPNASGLYDDGGRTQRVVRNRYATSA